MDTNNNTNISKHQKVKKRKKQKAPKKKDISQTIEHVVDVERMQRKQRKKRKREKKRKAREMQEFRADEQAVDEGRMKRKQQKRMKKEEKNKAKEMKERKTVEQAVDEENLQQKQRDLEEASIFAPATEEEKKRKISHSDIGERNNVNSTKSTTEIFINDEAPTSDEYASPPISPGTKDTKTPSDELLMEAVDKIFDRVDISSVKVSEVYSMLANEFNVSMKGRRKMIKKRLAILMSNNVPATKTISIRKRAIIQASKMQEENDHDVNQYVESGEIPNRKIYFPSVEKGYADPIEKVEIDKHEKKGFVWVRFNGRYSCDEEWDLRFKELREYKENHGDCMVPQQYSENKGLGAWVAKQRHEYKLLLAGKKTALSEMRVKLLESEGFVWAVHEKMTWQQRFEQLIQYKAKYGDCSVPQHYEGSRELGLWVAEQRRQYSYLMQGKDSSMTESKVLLLEAQGFVWSQHKGSWQQRLNELEEFRREHGHCRVPASHENKKLARWVSYQRAQYKFLMDGKKSQMTKGKLQSLIALGFTWSLHRKTCWEDRLKELIRFRDDHGHCDIPKDYVSNPKLAAWAWKQRHGYTLFKQGKDSYMTEERMNRLIEVGFQLDISHQEEDVQKEVVKYDRHEAAM
eukprot:CAMPEP_0196815602 /NCGR_PEP_ID=MMETSP1362-20130617/50747_1 /TAXON_ID=163516 /ORGANISM="Leptocylindrus danicus, Strain CCMP1856" /LENGTH=630 /DNA_ID=CAMNT_0042192627 /DNA_START=193 /DNA_END=2085 /DNA_ORIENTATION=+